MTNSRSKGSKNERDLAKAIGTWSGYEFTRTPSSGGLRWKKTDNIAGDIVCTDSVHRFPFCIEAKSYKEINFEHLLLHELYFGKNPTPAIKNTKILEFWEQAYNDSLRAMKIPILFMRYNNLPKNFHFVVIQYDFYKLIQHKLTEVNTLIYNEKLVLMPSTVLFGSRYKSLSKIAKIKIKETWPRK